MRVFRASPFLSILFLSLLLVSLPHLLTAHGDSSPSCSNPLFTSPLTILNHSLLSLHLTPQPPSTPTSCPSLSSSCCTSTGEAQIDALMTSLLALRASLPDCLPSLLVHSLFFHSPHLDLPPSAFASLTSTQHIILRRYSNLVTPIIQASTPCLDAVLTYLQGFLCLACDPTSPHYTDDGHLQLHWHMCEKTTTACQPTLDWVAAALPSLLDLFIAFLVAHPTPLTPLTSTTLSHALLLRSLLSDVHASDLCNSDALGLYTGAYTRYGSCDGFICHGLLRGLDWDVMGWLNVSEGEAMVIDVPRMRRSEEVVAMPAAPAHHMENHARSSPFSLMSLLPSSPPSRFHPMHANLHPTEAMEATVSVDLLQQPLVTMPARPNDTAYAGDAPHNGKPVSTIWGDEDGEFYPIWQVGCEGLKRRGVVCPAGEELVMHAQKWTFLAWVAAVAVVVSLLVALLWRLWSGAEGGVTKTYPTQPRAHGKTKRFSLRKPKASQDAEAEEGILQ